MRLDAVRGADINAPYIMPLQFQLRLHEGKGRGIGCSSSRLMSEVAFVIAEIGSSIHRIIILAVYYRVPFSHRARSEIHS